MTNEQQKQAQRQQEENKQDNMEKQQYHEHEQQTITTPPPTTTGGCPYGFKASTKVVSTTSLMTHTNNNNNEQNDDYHDNDNNNIHNNVMVNAELINKMTSSTSWKDLSSMVKDCPAFQNGSCPFKDLNNTTAADDTVSSTTNTDHNHDIRKTLLQIPLSHYQDQHHQFYQMIQQFHQTVETIKVQKDSNDTSSSSLPTSSFQNVFGNSKGNSSVGNNASGCPVANLFMVHVANSSNTNSSNSSTDGKIPQSDEKIMEEVVVASTTNADAKKNIMIKDVASMKFTEAIEHYSLASIMARMASSAFDDDDDDDEEEEELEEEDIHEEEQNDATGNKKNRDNQNVMEEEVEEKVTTDDPIAVATTTAAAADVSAVDHGMNVNNQIIISDDANNDPNHHHHNLLSLNLAECFKIGTIDSHQEAEDVHFVKQFICGNIDLILYKDLLIQLFYVYNTLEYYLIDILNDNNTNNNYNNPSFECLRSFLPYHIKLQRKQTLIDDIDYWYGSTIMERIVEDGKLSLCYNNTNKRCYMQSIACYEYVQRLHMNAINEPILLIAHSYTRYLGDLSGGKILARVAKKALHLSSNDDGTVDGLIFYDFTSTIISAKKFKDEYKNVLNSLPSLLLLLSSKTTSSTTTSSPQKQQQQYEEMIMIHQLVSEANIAFVLNMRLFEELDVKAGIVGCTVRSYNDAINKYTIDYNTIMNQLEQQSSTTSLDGNNEAATLAAKCPFASLSTSTSSQRQSYYSKTSVTHLNKENNQNTNSGVNPNSGSKQQQSSCPFANIKIPKDDNENKQVCPFAKGQSNTILDDNHVPKTVSSNSMHNNTSKRCPWPFIFVHDPIQGLYDWQTWAFIGCIIAYGWYQLNKY